MVERRVDTRSGQLLPLFPERTNRRRRGTLAQQQQRLAAEEQLEEECSDPFPTLGKRGKATMKVGGSCLPPA